MILKLNSEVLNGVNARVLNGNIDICTQFFENKNLTDKDRVAIIYHEVFHIKNDMLIDSQPYEMEKIIVLENVPPYIKSFIIEYIIQKEFFSPEEWKDQYLMQITFKHIYCPEYYQNEIAAYQNEIEILKDVSNYYRTLSEYKLWEAKQLFEISKKHYKK